MYVLTHWTKVVPATAGAVLVGWVTPPAQAFFPSYMPEIVNRPQVTPRPRPPAIPPTTPIPPVSPPPFVPPPPVSPPPPPVVPPPPNTPDDIPDPPCDCDCGPNTPSETPEPATLVSGLIGLGVAAAARNRRRFVRGKEVK